MINILEINEDKLYEEIHRYRDIYKNPDYLICSESTLELLEVKYKTVCDIKANTKNTVSQFMGINIANCNALKLGEFDLR